MTEQMALSALADVLYSFLPGSGNAMWKGHVNFHTVARRVGVGDFCQPGSKLPMITTLLELTLQQRPHLFDRLIQEVVRAGIVYRQKQGSPIRREEIDSINGLLLQVGHRIRDLWDDDFRQSLGGDTIGAAQQRARDVATVVAAEQSAASDKRLQLIALRDQFIGLCANANRQQAGLSLEKVLNGLFGLSGLSPREPFRVTGEQIDGSFELDHETYILEAKWEQTRLSEQPLLVFRGKIEGKSAILFGTGGAIVDMYTTTGE